MFKKIIINKLPRILLLVWILTVVLSWVGHLDFKEENQRRLESKVKDYTTFLQVALNAQAWNGFYPLISMMSMLSDLVNYTELHGVILIDGNGKVILQTGEELNYSAVDLIKQKIIWNDQDGHGYFTNLATLPQGYFTKYPSRDPEKLSSEEIDRRISMCLERMNCRPRCAKVDEFMLKEKLTKQDIDEFIEQVFGDNHQRQVRYIFHKELEGQKLTPLKLLDLMNVLSLFRDGGNTPPPPPTRDGRVNLKKVDVTYFTIVLPQKYEQELIAADLINRIKFNTVSFIIMLLLAYSWRSLRDNAELRGKIMVMESKSEALKDLNMAAAGIVHETKNPLNLIRGLAQMLTLQQANALETRNVAKNIAEEVDIVTSRLNQFLAYSKPRQPKLEVFCFHTLVKELFELLKYDLDDNIIEFSCIATEINVEADRDMLRQILFNLLINSIKAITLTNKAGFIEVKLLENAEKNSADIFIKDSGKGISSEIAEDIFRPYFTTNESGTGLGLSIVRQLASANNWQVEFLSDCSETTFVIRSINIVK